MKTYHRVGITIALLCCAGSVLNFILFFKAGTNVSASIRIASLMLFALVSILCFIPMLQRLKIIHLFFFLLISVINSIQSPAHPFGYLAFSLFVLSCWSYGYMHKNAVRKSLVAFGGFSTTIVLSIIIRKLDLSNDGKIVERSVTLLFFYFSYLILLYQFLRDNISKYMKKEIILAHYNLKPIDETIIEIIVEHSEYMPKDIALKLGATSQMVYKRLERLYHRFGVRSFTELVRLLAEHRIV